MPKTNETETAKNLQKKLIKWAIVFLALVNLFVWLAAIDNHCHEYLEVAFFNVGQGDSAFIQSPEGSQILVDGGPGPKILEKLGHAMPFWDRDIDLVILTHPDRDHLAGLIDVLQNYRVKKIIWSGVPGENSESEAWMEKIDKEQADIMIAKAGDKLSIDNNQSNYIEILSPDPSSSSAESQNENSVVAQLVYGQHSFLLTGDIGQKSSDGLGNNKSLLRVDILKVAHHGSKYSTSEQFLADLLPAAAVISVGKGNSYGHPAPEVLELLSKYGIKTLRTDLDGDIVFRTDGKDLFVKTQK